MVNSVHKTGNYAIVAPNSTVGRVSKTSSYAVLANPPQVFKTAHYAILVPRYPPFHWLNIDSSFTETSFPDCVSYGTAGGPGFKTGVFTTDSGDSSRVPHWDYLRASYNVNMEDIPPDRRDAVNDLFYRARGQALGFRFKDFADYQVSNQNVFVGDGTTTEIQLFKRYISGTKHYDRPLRKLVTGSLVLLLDGVSQTAGTHYNVLENFGIVHMFTAPAVGEVVSISYLEFDVPVRFSDDTLNIAADDFRSYSSQINLIEIQP